MNIIKCIILLSLLVGCSRETLSPDSVVDSKIAPSATALDNWIQDSITAPYGITVEYRWNRNSTAPNTYPTPTTPEKVKEVLKTIKYLWLETYTLPNIGKIDFMKGKNPIKIYIYGGKNIDYNGVELINHPNTTGIEMFLYNAEDFDSKDADKVFILMRSVHHQFAKRLTNLIPYDRDAFLKISQKKYTYSTNPLKTLIDDYPSRKKLYSLDDYFNKRGFFTMHSTISPEDDFAEIVSATIMHSQKEIEDGKTNAKTPYKDYGSEPEVQQMYNEQAKQAYKEFTEKQAFVEDYFEKKLKINLRRLQLINLERMTSQSSTHTVK